eukprot:snap_masked-scaffold_6-processed-gene-18.25-mRNA-1 protein AED:1.00 eAED:1.00 QI:0/-1/0/0/-1/1/1/0/193
MTGRGKALLKPVWMQEGKNSTNLVVEENKNNKKLKIDQETDFEAPLFTKSFPKSGYRRRSILQDNQASKNCYDNFSTDNVVGTCIKLYNERNSRSFWHDLSTKKSEYILSKLDFGSRVKKLPKGWSIEFSKEHQRPYFYSAILDTSHWSFPTDDQTSSPEQYELLFNEEHQRYFVRNKKTQEFSWTIPKSANG